MSVVGAASDIPEQGQPAFKRDGQISRVVQNIFAAQPLRALLRGAAHFGMVDDCINEPWGGREQQHLLAPNPDAPCIQGACHDCSVVRAHSNTIDGRRLANNPSCPGTRNFMVGRVIVAF